jgi:hypothetical protein
VKGIEIMKLCNEQLRIIFKIFPVKFAELRTPELTERFKRLDEEDEIKSESGRKIMLQNIINRNRFAK